MKITPEKLGFMPFLQQHPNIKMSQVEKLKQAKGYGLCPRIAPKKTYMHGLMNLMNLKHFANLMVLDYLIRYLKDYIFNLPTVCFKMMLSSVCIGVSTPSKTPPPSFLPSIPPPLNLQTVQAPLF